MMKRLLRCVCFVLIAAMLLSTTGLAVQTPGTYSLYFVSCCTWMYKLSDLTFEVGFDVTTKRTMDELGVRVLKVQRSEDGVSNWTTVKTYTPNIYPQMSDANSFSHMDAVTFTGHFGYYYRSYAEFYATDSTGTGIMYDYSEVVYIPPNT